MILDHIARTRQLGLPHVYLGYWVKGSAKMHYKTRFQPQEHLTPRGWELFTPEQNSGSAQRRDPHHRYWL